MWLILKQFKIGISIIFLSLIRLIICDCCSYAVLLQQASNPPATDNTNWLLVVITAILAAITGYYAWQTKKSVITLEESTKAQFKPFLKWSIAQIGPDSLELQITNISKGSAEEITINFIT